MTTLGEFKKKVLRVMGEEIIEQAGVSGADTPIRGTNIDSEFLIDGCHAALNAITIKQWKSAVFQIDLEGDSFELPPDFLEIEAVFDNELQTFLPKLSFELGTSLTTSAIEGNAWVDTPQGFLGFTNGLKASGAIVYYSALWSLPVSDEEELEAPGMCLTALVLYAASYCFLQKASQQGELSQFKTRVDSGQPEDIPAQRISEALLKRFENEMTRVPAKQKGTQ